MTCVLAVQTLSRLNRTTKGKEDTFVLDFAKVECLIEEPNKNFKRKYLYINIKS